MFLFFLHLVDSWVLVHHFPVEETTPGCTMGRGQAGGGSVMCWAMFCRETLGPGIHADVTLTGTTYLNIVSDQVYPLMRTAFHDGSLLFQ